MMGCLVSGVGTLQMTEDIAKWCGHSSDKGTLQMTEHSQRCGYSLKLTRQVPRMKPCRQVLGTKSSRQAPRTKSPGTKPSRQAPRTKPSRQAPRTKSLRTKPSRQVPRTKPSRQAPRTKSPGTKPSRQAPRSKSPGTKPSRQAPRMKPCRQVPRANPTDHTSLPMYVWGTFNSGFPKLRYGVKSHFFDSGTLQMTGHSQRCEYSSHYLAQIGRAHV